jgi:hypothetical protein
MPLGVERDLDARMPHLVANIRRRLSVCDELGRKEMTRVTKRARCLRRSPRSRPIDRYPYPGTTSPRKQAPCKANRIRPQHRDQVRGSVRTRGHPSSLLAGRQQEIHAERDRELGEAQKQQLRRQREERRAESLSSSESQVHWTTPGLPTMRIDLPLHSIARRAIIQKSKGGDPT